MDRRSATILAAALVVALMAGVVSREITLSHLAPGPIQIVQNSSVAIPSVSTPPLGVGGGD